MKYSVITLVNGDKYLAADSARHFFDGIGNATHGRVLETSVIVFEDSAPYTNKYLKLQKFRDMVFIIPNILTICDYQPKN